MFESMEKDVSFLKKNSDDLLKDILKGNITGDDLLKDSVIKKEYNEFILNGLSIIPIDLLLERNDIINKTDGSNTIGDLIDNIPIDNPIGDLIDNPINNSVSNPINNSINSLINIPVDNSTNFSISNNSINIPVNIQINTINDKYEQEMKYILNQYYKIKRRPSFLFHNGLLNKEDYKFGIDIYNQIFGLDESNGIENVLKNLMEEFAIKMIEKSVNWKDEEDIFN